MNHPQSLAEPVPPAADPCGNLQPAHHTAPETPFPSHSTTSANPSIAKEHTFVEKLWVRV
ncbi:hypothetical protein Pan189_00400 [Stratiformator vulcanicus]|uniref:Uncharacterized protein n=1 Tax=Stratiformator vulcanicus TaxID=2527980 RepID=A0A517QVU3_9PLAN|nr:hypothetical protein Pan189_00400 [Stratiformator vulcanicus]